MDSGSGAFIGVGLLVRPVEGGGASVGAAAVEILDWAFRASTAAVRSRYDRRGSGRVQFFPGVPIAPRMEAIDSRNTLVGWVLGQPGRQRVRTSQTLLAFGLYLALALVQYVGVLLGVVEASASVLLTTVYVCGATTFYLLVRTGLSRRFSKEPALTLPQCAFALCIISWAYGITGVVRGLVLAIMMLVLVFGVFRLELRQVRWLVALALATLGAVMAARCVTDPAQFDPGVEALSFAVAAVVLGSTTALSDRLGRMRALLSAQKIELTQALDLNRELATRDALTGLLNRRAMMERLGEESARHRRAVGALSVAMIDIDWFKRINDNHGHQVGDTVLRRFAELMRTELRAVDALARWGGEEFLLLMPGSRASAAAAAVERLRRRVNAADFATLAEGLTVTFSAGLAECIPGESNESVIERADRALYQAKQGGRDRVVIAPAACQRATAPA
jgi:diguanylate cyclase